MASARAHDHADLRIIARSRCDDRCRRLMSIPGVGTITALAYVAPVGDAAVFRNGWVVSAWAGLTPTRYQSGSIEILSENDDDA